MKPSHRNPTRLDGATLFTWATPALLLILYGLLATLPDLRLAVPELVGLTGLMVMLLGLILYQGEQKQPNWSRWLIIAIALLIRVPFLIRPSELSDDIHRYLWDGLRLLSGHNPYALAPADVTSASATLTTIKNSVNHPHLVTIYGPAAQLFFALAALLGGTVTGFKIALVLVDLGCCLLLWNLLRRLRMPPWKSVLYAWHPLPVLEIAGSGHIDGVGIFFLIAALLAVVNDDEPAGKTRFAWTAGLFLACAVLVKLWPALLLPGFLLLRTHHQRLFCIAFILSAFALILPFLPEIGNGLHTLRVYTANWEFNSFSFQTLRHLSGSAPVARMLMGALFVSTAIWLYRRLHRFLQTSPGPERVPALLETFYALALLHLLLTPTLHPWYALCLVWLLPFAAGVCGLIVSWSPLLAYQVLITSFLVGQWQEDELTAFLTWLGPVAALGLKYLGDKKGVPIPPRG